ncbi:uncharacterized protein LOC18422255 [Amborella trichopoda]|nr:uncharacterized protein LOC18422255 [Amborella trichopoda]|eukprot:XP_020520262.1 uncharacterized protein LOC18422255 [Amborella trichopoda]
MGLLSFWIISSILVPLASLAWNLVSLYINPSWYLLFKIVIWDRVFGKYVSGLSFRTSWMIRLAMLALFKVVGNRMTRQFEAMIYEFFFGRPQNHSNTNSFQAQPEVEEESRRLEVEKSDYELIIHEYLFLSPDNYSGSQEEEVKDGYVLDNTNSHPSLTKGSNEIANPIQSIVLYDYDFLQDGSDMGEESGGLELQRTDFGYGESLIPELEDVRVEDLKLESQSGESEEDETLALVVGFEYRALEREFQERREEEMDGFYRVYNERMKWFDTLNCERTLAISTMLNKQVGNFSLSDVLAFATTYTPEIYSSKAGMRRLMRSLQSDFETVYVGQSCLCWDALHHQFRKVQDMSSPDDRESIVYNYSAGRFQQFQVLLERFMENEKFYGERFWSYVQCRFSQKYFLHVPAIAGYLQGVERSTEKTMTPEELVRVIEDSIKTFWAFIKTDSKCSSWNLQGLFFTHPRVEDPRDLEVLSDLKRRLHAKEIEMKGLQRKNRCWVKRSTPIQESDRMEMLFCMIDMKLISRVLKMSTITSDQLIWCQKKLNHIEFRGGRAAERDCTGYLFPSS